MTQLAVESVERPVRALNLAVGILRDAEGRMLVVRKAGTRDFMQPGGKIDPGESPAGALCRELSEELGFEIDPARLTHLGLARAVAANEADTQVFAEVFAVSGSEWPEIRLTAEIEEARWLRAGEALPLAPLTEHEILPMIRHRGQGRSEQ